MISVAALIVSGSVNAWILVGSFRALLVTDYGLLLLLKIAAFATMIALCRDESVLGNTSACPRQKNDTDPGALSALTRNRLIELALGRARRAASRYSPREIKR